jgi:hypothetical protein
MVASARQASAPQASFTGFRRAGYFTTCLLLISFVGDGGPQHSAGFAHQLILLPVTALFLYCLWHLLFAPDASASRPLWSPRRVTFLLLSFEFATAAVFFYEAHHFAFVGYHLHHVLTAVFFVAMLSLLIALATQPSPKASYLFTTALTGYTGGVLLAIFSFPLTYLRSDMMPVILWADSNVLHHVNPYVTMHVANRVYDFPYLPGMIVAYLPFTAAHLDLRFASIVYVSASAALIYWAARADRRREVAALLALFLLSPYLQYRHELYLAPHWLTLAVAFVLMQRRHFAWAAFFLGTGMAIYQFSWIILPFVLINALRRRGWLEAAKIVALAGVGAFLLAGPFLAMALRRIGSNTVSQWSLLRHADAQPMNFSYWITYLIHPDKLLRLQALLMIAILLFCFAKKRCDTLEDTLRWVIVALTLFILCNVLVDGYFYLMLLVPMLVYTCVANGWWSEPEPLT